MTGFDIHQIRQHAREKGGRCLSNIFGNGKSKMIWKCNKGHQWKSSIQSVISTGSWCPVCAKNLRLTIEEMQEIAQERGGKCLSTEYLNSKKKLLWECAYGHHWHSTPLSIKSRKSWCPFCANNRVFSIEDMRNLAGKHGGKCLSKDYVNVKTSLLWQCEKGHMWKSTAENIKQERWCPHCKKAKIETNSDKSKNPIRQHARNGLMFQKDYSNHI